MGGEARIGETAGCGHAGTRDPNGWVRDESGALRRETIHSMLRRLQGWDYREIGGERGGPMNDRQREEHYKEEMV